jgi:hypothetical protein
MEKIEVGAGWVPQACTLPTAERPLRVAEFESLFAEAVIEVERLSAVRIRLGLRRGPGIAGRVAELAVAETGCCSFFTFVLTVTGEGLFLDVEVPVQHVEILDALAAVGGAG